MTGPAAPIPGWLPGHWISPVGRIKIVALAGAGSHSGDAEQRFASLLRYLQQAGGYEARRDLLEGTYAGSASDEQWQPRAYGPADTRVSLATSTEAVAGVLDWYRVALPADTRLCLVGFSLGGVVGLDGATLAVARDRDGWRGRLAAVVTFASPLRGTEAEAFLSWAWLGSSDLQSLGAAGDDLAQRWKDPQERQRVERRAAFLRAEGARVLTLADPDDAVVRPFEAVLPEPGQPESDLLVRATLGGSSRLGHGGLLEEPEVWRRVLQTIGPQETGGGRGAGSAPADPSIEDELAAIKARLRAQGRIK